MKFPGTYIVRSENETTKLADWFAEEIKRGDVISVNGKLGTGKTFFIKKVLISFGIDTANSPTFAIVNVYSNTIRFYHFDFYRIQNVKELIDIGINDYFADSEAITFIEWGNLYREILPQSIIEINIRYKDENAREFEFKKY
ncbi:MAG: tRNA (adenosine(37)-N6)-threonylcarbamoyltransferase complex ATPase subunit type 1 TsaE [Ignavibacteriaceae bacterium]